jgi:plasmid stabilization system protein ParE
MTAKETVRALLDRLPDDCSLDDVLYHLYVVQAVGEGLADAEAGRVMPHDEVAAELRRKMACSGPRSNLGSIRPRRARRSHHVHRAGLAAGGRGCSRGSPRGRRQLGNIVGARASGSGTSDPVIREIFVFRYRLAYRVEAERVVVVAFVHGARDFATWRQGQDSL